MCGERKPSDVLLGVVARVSHLEHLAVLRVSFSYAANRTLWSCPTQMVSPLLTR